MIQTFGTEWMHLMELQAMEHRTRGMVLLDTGANEVVRHFNQWEWDQIAQRKPHTRIIEVGLAMKASMQAGITVGGKLMRAPPTHGPIPTDGCGL